MWPTVGASCTTSWRHLQWLWIYPPDGATCIGLNFGHQVALLALVASLATRWRHLHCHIAYDCSIDIISWYWVVIFISQSIKRQNNTKYGNLSRFFHIYLTAWLLFHSFFNPSLTRGGKCPTTLPPPQSPPPGRFCVALGTFKVLSVLFLLLTSLGVFYRDLERKSGCTCNLYSYPVENITWSLSGLSCGIQSIVNPSLSSPNLLTPLIDISVNKQSLAGAQLIVNPSHSNEPNTQCPHPTTITPQKSKCPTKQSPQIFLNWFSFKKKSHVWNGWQRKIE